MWSTVFHRHKVSNGHIRMFCSGMGTQQIVIESCFSSSLALSNDCYYCCCCSCYWCYSNSLALFAWGVCFIISARIQTIPLAVLTCSKNEAIADNFKYFSNSVSSLESLSIFHQYKNWVMQFTSGKWFISLQGYRLINWLIPYCSKKKVRPRHAGASKSCW